MKKKPQLRGFRWIFRPVDKLHKGPRLSLIAPSGKEAATVYLLRDLSGHNWSVWNEHGTGGENNCAEVIEAMGQAEDATIRWGRHKPKKK